jgi:hypothetical protein
MAGASGRALQLQTIHCNSLSQSTFLHKTHTAHSLTQLLSASALGSMSKSRSKAPAPHKHSARVLQNMVCKLHRTNWELHGSIMCVYIMMRHMPAKAAVINCAWAKHVQAHTSELGRQQQLVATPKLQKITSTVTIWSTPATMLATKSVKQHLQLL